MCHYTHLTPFEREKILFFLAEGKSITEIAHLLNRSKSTISRELLRNAAPADQPMSYCPLTAQALYKQRRKACRPHKRLEYAPLHSYIQICILAYHWSPEEIVGRIQLEHGCRLVSVPTIYRAIHAGLLNPPGASAKFVLRKLRHHGKRRHKKGNEEHRGKFVISHPIEERPASLVSSKRCASIDSPLSTCSLIETRMYRTQESEWAASGVLGFFRAIGSPPPVISAYRFSR